MPQNPSGSTLILVPVYHLMGRSQARPSRPKSRAGGQLETGVDTRARRLPPVPDMPRRGIMMRDSNTRVTVAGGEISDTSSKADTARRGSPQASPPLRQVRIGAIAPGRLLAM